MSKRPLLPEDRIAPPALAKIAGFHIDVVEQVRRAVEKDPVVVVGMAQNVVVKQVRAALRAAQVDYTYLEFGSYFGQWKRRLAIKLWSGWPTFPQVFVHGTLLGGNHETRRALDDGSLMQRLRGSV